MQPGTYSFTVTFTDDLGQAGEATYNFTVQAPPLGEGHATTITDTETATFDPFGDSSGIGLQPLDASVIVQPASGSVGITDGTVTYTPVLGFVGDVWFSVTITDDLGQTVVLTYTVTVVPAELLPKVGETAGATDVANPSHPLSMTGGELGGLLALCATLLLVGALLIVRRKKHAVRPRVE
nr:Ig-like domain-containing protein [Lysinibacter cavernae]